MSSFGFYCGQLRPRGRKGSMVHGRCYHHQENKRCLMFSVLFLIFLCYREKTGQLNGDAMDHISLGGSRGMGRVIPLKRQARGI